VWNYYFYQDGSIEFEVRLTGILQTYVAGPNEPAPYATRVAPGIHAHFHQHLFSVRVDPMVDGLLNSVIETDVLPASTGYGSPENFAGNAFQVHDRVLRRANEGAREWDAAADRRWRIVSAGKRHHASGQLTGYSIGVKGGATVALPRPEGWVGRRATFARNTLWVVREKEQEDPARDGGGGGRMWPSGKFVPQAREEPADSLARWVRDDGDAKIENEDVLVYVTVGTTHIPRPEDWPVYVRCFFSSPSLLTTSLISLVRWGGGGNWGTLMGPDLTLDVCRMPVEHIRLTLKPNSFFSANPCLDVPGVKDEKSVRAFGSAVGSGSHAQGENCCA
jgi:primary-amine oxidase